MSFSKYSKMEQYDHYLFLEQYAEHLFLNTVNYLELKGSFKMFFPNLFTCILIKDSLAYLAEDILNPFGFCVPEKVEHGTCPGTHLSIMTPYEKERIPYKRGLKVFQKWKGKGQ